MASNKTTINKKFVVATGLLFLIGIGLGALIQDIPFVNLKREVDLGTIIAVLGLIATAFYLPNVVERKFKKTDAINEVIRSDIEAILAEVDLIKAIYRQISPTVKMKLTTYTEILSLFTSLSSDILALNTQLDARNKLPNFKEDVYLNRYIPTWKACTENLVMNQLLTIQITSSAITELDKLSSELRKYRYETFAEMN